MSCLSGPPFGDPQFVIYPPGGGLEGDRGHGHADQGSLMRNWIPSLMTNPPGGGLWQDELVVGGFHGAFHNGIIEILDLSSIT